MRNLLTILTVLLCSTSLMAQFSDPGFESWTSEEGYYDLTGWQTGNAISHSLTGLTAVERSIDTRTGESALRLKVIDHPMSRINGMAWTNVPLTDAPKELKGHYKFDAPGASVWSVEVVVMDKEGRPLGVGRRAFRELTDDWKEFNVPLLYTGEGVPALAAVQFCACLMDAPDLSAKGSELLIDDLNLVSPNMPEVEYSGITFQTYPNPTQTNLLLMMEDQPQTDVVLEWFSMSGEKLRMESIAREDITHAGNLLKVADLPRGMVLLRISGAKGDLIGTKRILLN